jgi:hypothetical protein
LKSARVLFATLLLCLLPVSLASAGGWGGIGACGQYFDHGFGGPAFGVSTISGYGYGVNAEGDRIGGFGICVLPTAAAGTGGIGGILLGHEWWLGPLVAGFSLQGGVGGASFGDAGYVLLYGQADIDIGVAVLPWMQITAYIGYQVSGNLFPGTSFRSVTSSAPVAGLRLAWGGR